MIKIRMVVVLPSVVVKFMDFHHYLPTTPQNISLIAKLLIQPKTSPLVAPRTGTVGTDGLLKCLGITNRQILKIAGLGKPLTAPHLIVGKAGVKVCCHLASRF
jgi:hypothetical protein